MIKTQWENWYIAPIFLVKQTKLIYYLKEKTVTVSHENAKEKREKKYMY